MAITPITLSQGSGEATVGSILYLLNLQSPAVYNPVGNVGNMKMGMKVKTADTTNQGTIWTQSIPTLLEGGTYTMDLHFIPGSAGTEEAVGIEGHGFISGLMWIFTQRQIRTWKLIWPDGSGVFFTAYITDAPVDMNLDKDLMAAIVITITGQPQFF